jgi:peroxiredoxin
MKNRTILKILIIIALLNFLVWGYLLVKDQYFKKKSNVSNPYRDFAIKKIKLPSFSIGSQSGENRLSSGDLTAKLNILIFFTFEDCASCLFEARFWGKAATMFSEEIKIFGIVNKKNDIYITDFIAEYLIPFPIIVDESDKLKSKILALKDLSKLGIITPFKVYISDNEIIQIEGPSKTIDRQENFLERVLKLLNRT